MAENEKQNKRDSDTSDPYRMHDSADTDEKTDQRIAELVEEVASLEAQLLELRERLEHSGNSGVTSLKVRWAGWILGTLAGATSLVLIVVLIGGGWSDECDCSESEEGALQTSMAQQQQQIALERLLRQNSRDIQECLEAWVTAHSAELRSGWAVLVLLEIEANETGVVRQVQATGEDLPVSLGNCLEQRVRRWTFPGPGPYTMELPFAIEAQNDSQPPSGDAGVGLSARDGS